MPSVTPVANAMYSQWLSGLSLRQVGRIHGLSHVTVSRRISRAYGRGATSIQRTSMLRSMLSDYGSLDEATCAKLASVKGCYYSNHTLDGYSRNYGAVYDNLDYAEASETDAIFPDEYLRWYYVRKSLDVAYGLLDSINKSITNRVNE